MSTTKSNWDKLAPKVLVLVAKTLDSYEDFTAFGMVCRSWRSAVLRNNSNYNSIQLPCLMLAEKPQEEEADKSTNFREFLSPTKNGMVQTVQLPEAKGKSCLSSLGWLLTTDINGRIQLLHPFTSECIHLPYPETFNDGNMDPRLYVMKAVLSASPSVTEEYVLMIIVGSAGHMAFWKPGKTSWAVVKRQKSVYMDVIYYKDRFYAIDGQANLFVCDINENPNDGITPQIVGALPREFWPLQQLYLVECCGELVVVNRLVDLAPDGTDDYWTRSFRVFKFGSTVESGQGRFEEVTSLGGRSLFLGHNSS